MKNDSNRLITSIELRNWAISSSGHHSINIAIQFITGGWLARDSFAGVCETPRGEARFSNERLRRQLKGLKAVRAARM